jgi:protein-disulfide isomerase
MSSRLTLLVDAAMIGAVVATGIFMYGNQAWNTDDNISVLPAGLNVSIDGAPLLGSPDAPVVMVEFSDFHCPSCIRYSRETFPMVLAELVAKGHVQYAFINAPLVQIHPMAGMVAKAALCAGRQGLFWQAHDRLFGAGKGDGPTVEFALAGVGLNESAHAECVRDRWADETLAKDLLVARQAEVRGTPTLFLGRRQDRAAIDWRIEILGSPGYAALADVVADVARVVPRVLKSSSAK